jgi:hypothetical protein
MNRISRLVDALLAGPRRVFGPIAAVFVPESGEEACVLLGLAMIAGAFLVAGLPALALGVPGALYIAIGLGFNLKRGR